MVSLPRLKQSFCGCSLETSSLIIAWLGVLGMAFQLLIGLCTVGLIFDNVKNEMQKKDVPGDQIEETMLQLKLFAAVLFVIYSISLAIDSMLLVGIYKRNHCLMTPWIFFSGCGCVLGILAVLVTFITAFVNPVTLIIVIIQGLAVAFGIYCYLLVYSYYAQIKEERQMNDDRFKPLGA